MPRANAERHFLRFQKKGNADDLAVVFDTTAPELLRVASHLTQDLHAAEDLLQATFLAAIQNRDRYEPRSGVLAWLTGILVNRAHMQRRERSRQPDTDRLPHRQTENPEKIAEQKELSKTVSDAIAALPEPYRPVLTLHLRNHLNAQEIALALDRPPGTVRTQIMRGMEMLRRALPTGLATGAAFAWTATPGLSAVRACVVEAARKIGPVVTSSAAAAHLLTLKKCLLAGGILLLATPVVYFSLDTPSADPGPQVPPIQIAADTVPPAVPELAAPAPTPLVRQELAQAPPPGPAVRLFGRCVDGISGNPLAGCTVTVLTSPPRATAEESFSPPPQVTDTDGRFDFAFPLPASHTATMEIDRAGMLTLTGGPFESQDDGWTNDLGDVALHAGVVVEGRVVDTDGQPQRDVELTLRFNPGSSLRERIQAGPFRSRINTEVRSSSDGSFRLPIKLRPRTWSVRTRLPEILSSSEAVEIAPSPAFQNLDLVVFKEEEIDTIRGRVVDTQGQTLTGIFVQPVNAEYPALLERGSFTFFRLRRVPAGPVLIRAEVMGREVGRTPEPIAWGSEGVELVVDKMPTRAEILVTDAETGDPVEDYRLHYFAASSTHRSVPRVRYPGGRASIEDLVPGHHALVIQSLDTSLSQNVITRFEVTSGVETRLHVEVPPRARRDLHVSYSDGYPVSGTEVQVLRPLPEPFGSQFNALQSRKDIGLDTFLTVSGDNLGHVPGGYAYLLDSGTTDSSGHITLSGPPGAPVAVRVLGPGHQAAILRDQVLDASEEPIHLVVNAGATILGKLEPVELLREMGADPEMMDKLLSQGARKAADVGLKVWLENTDSTGHFADTFPYMFREHIDVAEDGSFRMEHVPPGSWRLNLEYDLDRGSLGNRRETVLGIVEGLEEGETREGSWNLSEHLPARVMGRVLVNGRPYEGTRIDMDRGDMRSGELRFGATDYFDLESGRFRMTMPPGTYRPRIYLAGAYPDGNDVLIPPDSFQLEPGDALERDFHFLYRPARIRVLSSDGKTPVPGINLGAQSPWADYSNYAITDASGEALFEHLWPGETRLKIWPRHLATPDARQAAGRAGQPVDYLYLGSIQVTQGTDELRTEIVLPPESGY